MIVLTDKEVYSDAGKLVRRIGTESYFKKCIKLADDVETDFEEVDTRQIQEKTEPVSFEEQAKIILKAQTSQITTFSNNNALKIKDLFDDWIDYTTDGAEKLKTGQIIKTADGLWRVRQEHKAQKHYPPLNTYCISLWENSQRPRGH